MFPIPWNKAFRKKDGTVVNIADAMSGGGGGSDLPPHSSTDAGKVLTVADDGTLEWDEAGSGGGEFALSYDFTKIGSVTVHGVTYSDAGATFGNASGYIELSDLFTSNFTIYVDIGNMQLPSAFAHQRFIMTTGDSGLIYRSNDLWGFYAGTDWIMSDISDPNYFNNSTLRIYIDPNKKWHVYKNGTEIFTSLNVTINGTKLSIGSSSGDCIRSAVITGVRIYPGDYTE